MKHLRALIAVAALCGAIVQPAGADEARFDVAVTDAPARAFFQGLADGTPYNIVLQPGVGGTVTLKMKNVTLVEVLDAMREAYGYDYHRLSVRVRDRSADAADAALSGELHRSRAPRHLAHARRLGAGRPELERSAAKPARRPVRMASRRA